MCTWWAYNSYRFKGPRDDRVLRYDAWAHDDAPVYLIIIHGYVEQVTTTPLCLRIRLAPSSENKLPNSNFKIKYKN